MPRPSFPSSNDDSAVADILGDVEGKEAESTASEQERLAGPSPMSTWDAAKVAEGHPSNATEVEFDAWFEEQLALERATLLARLQESLSERLSSHHALLLQAARDAVAHKDALPERKSIVSRLSETGDCMVPLRSSTAPASTLIIETPPPPDPGGHVVKPLPPRPQRSGWSLGKASTSNRLSKHLQPSQSGLISNPGQASQTWSSSQNGGEQQRSATPQSDTAPRLAEEKARSVQFNGVFTEPDFEPPTLPPVITPKRIYQSQYLKRLSTATKSVRPEVQTHSLYRIVNSGTFELCTWVVIMLNMLSMSVEVQYTGCLVGQNLGHADLHDSCGYLLASTSGTAFTVVAILFSSTFTLEYFLRLYVVKWKALKSVWMWFDLLVLVTGVMDTVARLGPSVNIGVNPTALRTIRMAHMLRMVKVFRGRTAFQTLFLLIKAIAASRHALGWSLGILFCTMSSVGLVINQFLHTYLMNPDVTDAEKLEVYNYFGTYTRMLITMVEITLGNWAPPSRVLINNISQWWGFFIVAYRLLFGFSLVQVTGAIFITETNRVASDDEVQMMRKQRADVKTAKVLEELFTEIDTSCDGYITLEELRVALQDPLMQNLLEILEVDSYDMEELFQVMDTGTGEVNREDFIRALLRLRGQAKTSKLVAMMQQIRNLERKLDQMSGEAKRTSPPTLEPRS